MIVVHHSVAIDEPVERAGRLGAESVRVARSGATLGAGLDRGHDLIDVRLV